VGSCTNKANFQKSGKSEVWRFKFGAGKQSCKTKPIARLRIGADPQRDARFCQTNPIWPGVFPHGGRNAPNKANSPAGVRAERCQEAIASNKPNLLADRPEGPRGVRRVECAKQTQFGGPAGAGAYRATSPRCPASGNKPNLTASGCRRRAYGELVGQTVSQKRTHFARLRIGKRLPAAYPL
jgi:hypothetical protein